MGRYRHVMVRPEQTGEDRMGWSRQGAAATAIR